MIRLCCTLLLSIGVAGTSPVQAKLDGAELASSFAPFMQGKVVATGNDLDLAIVGAGFFQVKPGQGDPIYTRNGSFKRAGTGTLVTSEGYPLQPAIVIPPDATSVLINPIGRVFFTKSGTGMPTEIGTISLFRFANESGLKALGGNSYGETVSSGRPEQAAPGRSEAGVLHQGALESSRAQLVGDLIALTLASQHGNIHQPIHTVDQ